MLPRYSNISLEALDELNSFALSDSPASAENFSRRCSELARDSVLGGLGLLPKDGSLLLADLTIPSIRHYAECEALLHFPKEMQHPVEQVSACLSLLRRQEVAMKTMGELEPATIPMAEVQRRLSHLLVHYPVLMDHRMLIGVIAPEDDWVPIAHAIAETSFASLPRLSDGIAPKQLRLFASNRHVRAGLTRAAPDASSSRSSVRGKTPQSVAFDGGAEPIVANATRGAFLLSLLHIDRLAKDFTGRGVVRTDVGCGDDLYRALAKVFWDVALNDGRHSNVTRSEFLAAAELRSPFAKSGRDAGTDDEYELTVATASGPGGGGRPALMYHMASGVDFRLFGTNGDTAGLSLVERYSTEEMIDRTRAVIALLTDSKVCSSSTEAAQWLASISVGRTRFNASSAGPHCQPDTALGFLKALQEHGVTVVLDNVDQALAASAPTGMNSANTIIRQERGREAVASWQLALEIFDRTSSMERVIAAHKGEQAVVQAASEVMRGPRARRVL